MRLIVAGGREFNDYSLLDTTLVSVLRNTQYSDIVLICGNARGADSLGKRWAISRAIRVETYPAKWKELGRGAGHIRNAEMADTATHLVAFWDGVSRGTANMINKAYSKGLTVRVIRYDK